MTNIGYEVYVLLKHW